MKLAIVVCLYFMFVTLVHADDDQWSWYMCSNEECLRQILNNKEQFLPCKELGTFAIGVINKENWQCRILSKNRQAKYFEVLNLTLPDYYHWIPQEQSNCYILLHGHTLPGHENEVQNCYHAQDYLCRFKKNKEWKIGYTNSLHGFCTAETGCRSNEYQLYAYNRLAYEGQLTKIIILMMLVIVYGAVWAATWYL